MKKLLNIVIGLVALVILIVAAMIWIPHARIEPKPMTEPESAITAKRGEYIMRASDCLGCHTASDGKPFAGGLELDTPFGTIYSTNITPDHDTGIGDYALDDFRSALYDGVRKDGKNLYPAMLYDHYRFLSEADVCSMYKYFMEEVEPVNNKPPATALTFPFNQRWGVRAWSWIALKSPELEPVSDEKQINRGAYLVKGPAHCAGCHSPRNALMIVEGMTEADDSYLTGGELEGWSVPDLRSKDSVSGKWSAEQMAHYLVTGRNDYASSVGAMGATIDHSLQYLDDDDAMAIALYLKHLSGTMDADTPSPLDDEEVTDTEQLLTRAQPSMSDGAGLYLDNCVGCHFVDGRGAPEVFPALDDNVLVTADSPAGLIDVILHGAKLPSTKKRPARLRMQGHAWRLNDEEVAELATFIRQGWHNNASAVSANNVAPLRKEH